MGTPDRILDGVQRLLTEVLLPTYGYRCRGCGGFDLVRPMAQAAATALCPGCGEASSRVFRAPALRALDPGLRRALDAESRSADAPQVVSSVPGRARRTTPITTDPRHARLPRP
jgi:putative FmdB family regulatory protein